MFLLTKDGRAAYLAFVRNLPSQLLLLTPVVFFPQLPKFSWTNGSDLAVLAAFTVMLLFAMVSNFLEFFLAANDASSIKSRIDKLQDDGLTGFALAKQSIKTTPLGELLGFFVVTAFFYAGIGIIAFALFLTHKP
jgi:hypothetical protein